MKIEMRTTNLPEQEMAMQALMNQLYDAFKFFNYELFNNLLPDCGISIDVSRGDNGAYYAERFVPKDTGEAVDSDAPKLDQIVLNPVAFDRDELHVLSTLVHEMVHQWEQEYGKPGKGRYHNREWAESMKSYGLFPSSTGAPGGKETGNKVSHYIVEGGLFHEAAVRYIDQTGFSIEWIVIEQPGKKTTPRKRTYRCDCPQPVYANISGRELKCLGCDSDMVEDEL